ncbi:S9 family peptidase [Pseudoxanthomonas sp. LH2527]|uniref:S9 family peptidase n=1 Tax=Pseudoxanthomonas sp. LH2527 TaxID=2923249 RepID=UPI001F13D2B7|nr:S9 family peptidase [Pseudoxanthomonas sp. LH2527]MCH6483175.1 S9 family peptidase [Pseudoxanthomonas sp. LH2527]
MRKWILAALAAGLVLASQVAAAQVDVQRFIRKDKFDTIKISPGGDYLAATVPLEDRTVLAIMRRSDSKLTGTFALDKNSHVSRFWWVNPDRVVVSIAEKFGQLDQPLGTGELFAVDADGGKATVLVGFRIGTQQVGSNIQQKKPEQVHAFLVDSLPADDKGVVVSIWPWGDDPFTRAERLDVYSGRRTPIARAPVRNADFTTDNQGQVRFADGSGVDNARKLYYRDGKGSDWQLINDEAVTRRIEYPLGFNRDQTIAYLQVEQPAGPDAIVAWNIATGERKEVLRNANVDPDDIVYSQDSDMVPVGAVFADGKPAVRFFSDDVPEARLYRSLEAAFPGETVEVTSRTADGKLALVQVSSDRNPGDFYLFNVDAKKLDYVLSRRDWLDPEAMGSVQPVRLRARDGTDLHGYLTLPKGGSGKQMPMIVMPHGGPFGIRDYWGFDPGTQLLASAGYAVLQVNFRGSGGYGRAFQGAGARQWGQSMQDDVTDATRWAIQEGIADPRRICIYGASYGAYASLTGVAREPDLYRCAAGYVGVYDLPMMHTRGDIQRRGSGETYLNEWIGPRNALASVSPVNMADRIKVPVFLAAGGEDERAPVEHTELMERRLKAAGVPVETLYKKTEGHGFYKPENQQEYYTRLLAFFNKHLGGATAK